MTTYEEQQAAKRTEFIQGLRDLATWLEATPEAKLDGYGVTVSNFSVTKENVVALAQTSGAFEKNYAGSYFDLRRRFGDHVRYEMTIPREQVCVAKVVGKKQREVRDPEALKQVPMVIVEEDDVEWECLPLLADTSDSPS